MCCRLKHYEDVLSSKEFRNVCVVCIKLRSALQAIPPTPSDKDDQVATSLDYLTQKPCLRVCALSFNLCERKHIIY